MTCDGSAVSGNLATLYSSFNSGIFYGLTSIPTGVRQLSESGDRPLHSFSAKRRQSLSEVSGKSLIARSILCWVLSIRSNRAQG